MTDDATRDVHGQCVKRDRKSSSMMGSSDEERHESVAKVGDVTIGSFAGEEARQGTDHEHNLSVFEALKLYPTAVGWSIYFSLGVCSHHIKFTGLTLIEVQQVIMAR